MNNAISYIRFSSEKQTLGDSVRRQLKLAEDYARQHNLQLDTHSYRDLGISAFRGKNVREGALGAFLKAVDDGLIPKGTTLLVESLDRVTRTEVMEALEIFTSIINRGITLVTLNDRQTYSSESIKQNWTQLIISISTLARANEESATKSKRVKEGQAASRAAKKITVNCPAWLRVNEAGTKYVLVADKVKTVRKIFQLAAEGNGAFLIYKYLAKHNMPQMGIARSGWTVQAVMRVLHHHSVIGQLVSKANNEVIEDFYPAIIERETFYAVQEKIKQRHSQGRGRKGAVVANLLSGINRCGDCGSAMRFVRIPSGDHVNSYLECLNQLHGKGCKATKINYERLERVVLSELLIGQGIEGLTPIVVTDPAIPIRGELADKRAQIEKLNLLIEGSSERVAKNLLGRLDRYLEEVETLEKSLREVAVPSHQAAETLSALASAVDLYKQHASNEGAELREVRLQLQSSIKAFVEHIDLPSKVYEPYGIKYRAALIKLRGLNIKRLRRPKASVVAAQHPDADIYDALTTPTEQLSKEDDVLTVYYEVPKMGNQGNVGERRRRKGKFV